MKTTHVRATDVPERWYLFDATQEPIGRMAARIATMLQGKDQPTYTYSENTGAHVVVINAERCVFTGKKNEQKIYPFYSGFPGGLKERDMDYMRERTPEMIVTLAVRRMLPKSRLGRDMLRNLKVYAGAEHPHTAQKPVAANG
ncbi:50S ribosomal protein L13 [Planctomycetes bacterium Pla163]|jgi:large subunit ribosomal protein L13|uniref:Large ribosomal subunit protein uL13 n=1 Tax=Rohdeia mirabilis TaxID=2528008 RepID=A0A518D1T2_9BACT|nr:50S ribosomal protein L13 [Planctomycetes bacterium Pla163]